jgi:hypothetical protein
MAVLIVGIPIFHCLEKRYDEEEFEARKTAMRDYSKVIKTLLRKVGQKDQDHEAINDDKEDGDEIEGAMIHPDILKDDADKAKVNRIRLRAGVLIQ